MTCFFQTKLNKSHWYPHSIESFAPAVPSPTDVTVGKTRCCLCSKNCLSSSIFVWAQRPHNLRNVWWTPQIQTSFQQPPCNIDAQHFSSNWHMLRPRILTVVHHLHWLIFKMPAGCKGFCTRGGALTISKSLLPSLTSMPACCVLLLCQASRRGLYSQVTLHKTLARVLPSTKAHLHVVVQEACKD